MVATPSSTATSRSPVAPSGAKGVRPPNDATDAFRARLWSTDLPREHGFEPLIVEGTLPPELHGTLYRNGPGLFGQHGVRYSHPFEGDGAVTAIRLDHGTALGASRISQTKGLVEERGAGKLLYGMTAPWWRRVKNIVRGTQKNTANTSVMMWQGRLFALMEGAIPTELDPHDLAMRGESTLGGTVVSMFSAHPHRVAARKAIYNFGIEYGRATKLHMYALPDEGPARHLGAIELPYPPMLHDFIATDTHLVFFVSPVRVDVARMLTQVGGFADMFRWRPERGTEIICVPIDRPSEVVRFTTDAFYQWHFTNAFDRGRELVVDYIRYPNFDSFYEIGKVHEAPRALLSSAVHRAVIDLDGKKLRSDAVMERACEFPTVAPGMEGREHTHSYLVLDNLAGVGKLDGRTGALTAHVLGGTQAITEPLFVGRPGATRDDEGWLLALGHDAPTDRAFLAVYDAERIPDGPIARAYFDHQVPITFHGTYAPA
jgi:all-trans-8'-apo-beta-carotenal 15,15'-oxygenase